MATHSDQAVEPRRNHFGPADDGLRGRLFHTIFEHDTPGAKLFDIALIVAILTSVLVTMLDSVAAYRAQYGAVFYGLEWGFTLVFTVEYLVRLWVVDRPGRYARSFFGVIDLLAVLPTYLALLFAGTQYLLVIRILRILRIFRVLKLVRYIDEASVLADALSNSWRKILVFLAAIVALVTVFGAVMYLVEGPDNGFDNIPLSAYWAIVTVATVGFGDIAPVTPLGRSIASVLILIGYGIIAVPTGIYTAELAGSMSRRFRGRRCAACGLVGHETDALHCRHCGEELPPPGPTPD
ncbi:MAG: ion transporter [Lysobacteraceae bacterium]